MDGHYARIVSMMCIWHVALKTSVAFVIVTYILLSYSCLVWNMPLYPNRYCCSGHLLTRFLHGCVGKVASP